MRQLATTLMFLWCLFFAFTLSAQGPQLASVIRPSPEQQAMQKYGDIPVSAYTGVPNISIPIYTIKYRDITVPISISYHASGVKVEEEASRVGLGWALNAGGSISRNIMDEDDFNAFYYFNGTSNSLFDMSNGQGPTNFINNGCIMGMFNKTIADSPTLYTRDLSPYLTAGGRYDFQPDQYYYNLPGGQSGKFILKRNYQAVIQKPEKLSISVNTAGTVWQVIGQDGTTYDFTVYETTNTPGTGVTSATAWYLTKITSPAGNTVTFSYTTLSNYVVPVGSYSETKDAWDGAMAVPMGSGPTPVNNSGTQAGFNPGRQYTCLMLSSISFGTGSVVFNYSTNRQDLTGEERLDSVCVFKAGSSQALKTVAFNYGYFNGTYDPSFNNTGGATTVQAYRLKLTSVVQKGYYNGQQLQENPYVFTYNEFSGSGLPAKTSFARDHWGYYNGKLGRSTLIPVFQSVSSPDIVTWALGLMGTDRDPDSNFAKAFILTSIKYPTSGSTEFQYQSNDFDLQASQVNDHSYFGKVPQVYGTSQQLIWDAVQKKVVTTDTLDMRNEYVYTQNPLSGASTSYTSITAAFRFGNSGDCSTYNLMSPGGSGVIYFELYDSTGTNLIMHIDPSGITQACGSGVTTNCLACGGGVLTYTFTANLNPAKYVFRAYSTGTTYSVDLQQIVVNFNWYAMQYSQPTYSGQSGPYFSVGGGLRICRIIDHDSISSNNDKVRKYIYHYWADKTSSGTPQEYSYGRRMSKPQYSYFSVTLDANSQNTPTGCRANYYFGAHLMRSSDSDVPLNGSAAGSAVGYDQVTELDGENGENGKKVYNYYNQPDYVYSYGDPYTGVQLPMRPPYSSNIADMQNGSLLEETDYANATNGFIKVKDVQNQYTVDSKLHNDVYGFQYQPLTGVGHGDNCANTNLPYCDPTTLLISFFSFKSDWVYLSSTDDKLYNQGDTTQYLETYTKYYYDDTAHLMPTRVIANNSKGEQITTTTTYPLDYTTNSTSDAFNQGVKNLVAKHVIAAPVEKYVQKNKSDGTNIGVVGSVLTTYNSSGDPTPSLIYESMLTTPSTTFTPASINTSGLVKDASYESLISFDSYDANGNILQQHKISDNSHAYIWDYQASLPVAEAINAPQAKIAYTSFEADGSGNWNITSTTMDNTKAITGSQSYNLANGSINKNSGIVAGDTLVVSYWSKNGSYSVTGTIGSVLTGKTVAIGGNSWTYYEHTVTGVTTVTVSGSGNIDELRLYPKYAQMTSYTFEPLIGMTSQCDINNRVSYYEYDGLGRLKDIKDQDGNILKTFEYHYKQ